MAKKTGTIRPGTFLQVLLDGRIRHAVVTDVTDQNNVEVRVGGVGNDTSTVGQAVARQESTTTRGSLFVAP